MCNQLNHHHYKTNFFAKPKSMRDLYDHVNANPLCGVPYVEDTMPEKVVSDTYDLDVRLDVPEINVRAMSNLARAKRNMGL